LCIEPMNVEDVFVQAAACLNSMCLNSHVTTEGCPITKGKLSELIDMMQVTSAENTGTMPHDNGNWTAPWEEAQSAKKLH